MATSMTEKISDGTRTRSRYGFFVNNLYIALALLLSIPVFVVINHYVNSIGIHEDETVSFAATVCFILGIFAGRYIIQFWTTKLRSLPKTEVILLATFIVICMAWLFYHADFPLQGRTGINLMLFWMPFILISMMTGALIKIIHAVTQNQLQEAQTLATTSKSELHLLQSQLSPHFLFNTLNNMYGISISDHQKIPELLLKLSELLRYSVYETTEIYVPVKEEITYIKNYIEFEKIRIGDRLVLNTEIEDLDKSGIKLAPMLLIVFIENAFKHAKNTVEEKIYIDIKLSTWGNSILFSVKNSYDKNAQAKNEVYKNSGLGLANVNKRLELLYPRNYMLNIQEDVNAFLVELQLRIK